MRCRDYIRLLIEGFSFHTLELKYIFSYRNRDAFDKIKNRLDRISSGKEFYELTKYGEGKFFCGHFCNRGIRIFLTELSERDVIKLVINPRKLIDPKADYLGTMLCDDHSLKLMEKNFAAIMKKITLPTDMDDWFLTRMDLTVNFVFDRKKLPRQIIELISRGPVAKGFEKEREFTYYSARFPGEKATLGKHAVKFKNQSITLVAYDKPYQMKQENLSLPNEMIPRGILRLELQCGKDWINKRAGHKKTTEKIRFLVDNRSRYLTDYALKLLVPGEYCKPSVLEERIRGAKHVSKKVKKRMLKFVHTLGNSHVSFDSAVQKMELDLGKKKVRTLLETFEKLGLAPIPLNSKCKLKSITSIPSVLEQLGEDGLDTRLYKKNKKRPKLILACREDDEGMDL